MWSYDFSPTPYSLNYLTIETELWFQKSGYLKNLKIFGLFIGQIWICFQIGPLAFRNMRIKHLILDDNKIRKIDAKAFHGLEFSMQKLSLANNKLTEVPTDSLRG